jgi:hypothetical protein
MEAKLKRPEGKPAEGHALHSRAALRGIKHEGEYLPIEDHGIVGNMRTVALVGRNATIDWMCFPHFDVRLLPLSLSAPLLPLCGLTATSRSL